MTWFWTKGWIGLSVLLWVSGTISLGMAVASGASPYILAIAFPSLVLVGFVIGIRRPEVKVGQLLAISGGAFACSIAVLPVHSGQVGEGVLLISGLIWPIAVPALIGALLVFPDGQLRSPRWRWLAVALVVWGVLYGAASFLEGRGPDWAVLESLRDSWFAVGMVLLLGALTSLVIRARTGTGTVRRQIGWLGYGVASYIVFLLTAEALFFSEADPPVIVLVDQIFFTAIPLAIWVAVSRYRLYDLDRLVSRTAAYVMVVGVLAATYLSVFALFSYLLPVEDEIGVAASTLAAVAVFAPVRRRVLAIVDRRFFRTRYQSQEVFDGFARRLRARPLTGPQAIEGELVVVLGETLAPESVAVWVRPS